jgi:hypothetical protein
MPPKVTVLRLPLQRFTDKYHMRPMCNVCNQRMVAINYRKDDVVHYRSRCDRCIKQKKKIRPPEALWKKAGYKKKPTCDRCGFKAKYAAQLLVYHVDGNLNNTGLRNLKTICLNCVEEVKRADLPWRAGDLEPDR